MATKTSHRRAARRAARQIENAVHLGLINHIDEHTGASVGMWRDVHCAPVAWGEMLRAAH